MQSQKDNYYCADLHIHIGSARGRAVKITASRNLQLKTILYQDAPVKGLDIVGIVDAGSLLVTAELEEMLATGDLMELEQGGFLARNGVLLITACEVESREGVHLLSYLPGLPAIRAWQKYMQTRIHNLQLSTQRANASLMDIANLTRDLEGVFCLAHAFTPHKGVYGMWTAKLANEIGAGVKQIKVLELGLSSDTDMADTLNETRAFTYISNSDAHSSANIGREYNQLQLINKDFADIRLCLENQPGRRVTANYGLHPLLGKYYRSYCPICRQISEDEPPVTSCRSCGNQKMVMGVCDRIAAIRDGVQINHPEGRPPYFYRIPLKDLPGIGPMTYNKLLQVFSNEIEVMETVPIGDIEQVVGERTAQVIDAMRRGQLSISPGGGGQYGKVSLGSAAR